MIQEPKVDYKVEYKSSGYEIEVKNVDTGSVVEIRLEVRSERWTVRTDRFYGSYSSLETAVTEALKLMEQKLRS